MSQTSKEKTPVTPAVQWPYRPKTGLFKHRDVYIRSVMHLLKKNKEIKRSVGDSRFKFQRMYLHENGHVKTVADWERFQVISDTLFWIASASIIGGWRFGLGKIGYLQATSLPANPRSLTINWKQTNAYIKENNLPASITNMMLYEPGDYCTVRFYKNDAILGTNKIEYSIANYSRNKTSLKDRFVLALTETPLLKLRYKQKTNDI